MAKAKNCNYAVLDCETGGKKWEESPITEIAIIVIDGVTFNEVERYETFIRPYGGLEIQQGALDYTGITMDQINGGIDFKEAVKIITDMMKRTRANTHHAYKPIIVGHNVKFDIGFISDMFKRAKVDMSKVFNEDYFCTMRLDQARNYTDPELTYGLEFCCDRANIELFDAHGAMNDTVATKNLFIHHMQALRSGEVLSSGGGDDRERFRDDFKFELAD